jgi:hypothetical protein
LILPTLATVPPAFLVNRLEQERGKLARLTSLSAQMISPRLSPACEIIACRPFTGQARSSLVFGILQEATTSHSYRVTAGKQTQATNLALPRLANREDS